MGSWASKKTLALQSLLRSNSTGTKGSAMVNRLVCFRYRALSSYTSPNPPVEEGERGGRGESQIKLPSGRVSRRKERIAAVVQQIALYFATT